MPHFAKPFYKKKRGVWYVEINRKQINLGPDQTVAFDRYHDLMRQQPQAVDCTLAVGVLEAFLAWVQQNKSARTYEWYQRHCKVFARSLPPLLAVSQLKKHHLSTLLANHPKWSASTKNGVCRAVCRAFAWAADEDFIAKSPLSGFKKPKLGHREVVISPAEYAAMRDYFQDERIRDLLAAAWETAARPQEIAAVEARHVDFTRGRWVFPAAESKGKTFPRVVYLNATALEITRRLAQQYPTGKLFRNTEGLPWNRFSLNCVFGRLKIHMGMRYMKENGLLPEALPRFKRHAFTNQEELAEARVAKKKLLYERRKTVDKQARKHGRKYTLYHFRHSWATRALQAGVDPLTVSILLGHTDPSTLAKTYQHLALDPDFLAKAITKASQGA